MRFECKELSKSYETRSGHVSALDQVSFEAEGHEFVGIVEKGPKEWLGKRVVGEINLACGRCA